jgi:hypothetical protein
VSEDLFDIETKTRLKAVFDEHIGAQARANFMGRCEERLRMMGKSKADALEEVRILAAEGRKAMALGRSERRALDGGGAALAFAVRPAHGQ